MIAITIMMAEMMSSILSSYFKLWQIFWIRITLTPRLLLQTSHQSAELNSSTSTDADSSSESDEYKVSETAASSAATATLCELLDQQQVEKSDLVSEAMAHTVKTRLEKKKDRYKPVPENMVPFLKETSINREIFHGIPQWAKANDRRYAKFLS